MDDYEKDTSDGRRNHKQEMENPDIKNNRYTTKCTECSGDGESLCEKCFDTGLIPTEEGRDILQFCGWRITARTEFEKKQKD